MSKKKCKDTLFLAIIIMRIPKGNFLDGLEKIATLLLSGLERQARLDGYNDEEVEEIMMNAKSGGYDHLWATVMTYYCGKPHDFTKNDIFTLSH